MSPPLGDGEGRLDGVSGMPRRVRGGGHVASPTAGVR